MSDIKPHTIAHDDSPPAVPARTEPSEGATPPPEPSALEKRLSSIIGVTNELRQNDTNRNTEIAGLKEVLVGMNQKLDAIGSPAPAAAPPASQPVDPFSAPQPAPDPATATPQNFQDSVNAAVQKALQPFVQQNTENQDRLTKHQLCFAKVVERDPAFADPTSQEKQYFDQVFNTRRDLQLLDDAPAVVAEMVRGLLSGQRLDDVRQDLAKVRSTLPSSAGRATPQGDPEKVREALATLQAKGETTELTTKERGDYLNLATAVAHLDQD